MNVNIAVTIGHVADSKNACNSIQKNVYYSKLILLQGLYCSGLNAISAGVVYLIIAHLII